MNVEASHCYPDLSHFFREVVRVPASRRDIFSMPTFSASAASRTMRDAATAGGVDAELEFVSEENISRSVLRGMQLNNERYQEMIRELDTAPASLARRHGVLWARKIPESISAGKSGKTIYFFLCVLRKPVAIPSETPARPSNCLKAMPFAA